MVKWQSSITPRFLTESDKGTDAQATVIKSGTEKERDPDSFSDFTHLFVMQILYRRSRLIRISRDGSIGVMMSLECLEIMFYKKYSEHRPVASPTGSLGELCLKMRIESHTVHHWRLYLRKNDRLS